MIIDTTFDLMALSLQLGVADLVVVHHAVSNLRLLAAYQAGTKGDAEAILRLMSIPRGSESYTPNRDVSGVEVGSPLPPVPTPAPEARGGQETRQVDRVLAAARLRTASFSSRDLTAETGIGAAKVAMHLHHARWPREEGKLGRPAIWLPKKSS